MNGNESVCLPSNLDSNFWILASGQQTFGGGAGVSRVSATAGGIQMNPWWGAGFLPWIWTFGPPRAMWLPFPQFLPGTHVWFACILFGGGGEMEFLQRKSYVLSIIVYLVSIAWLWHKPRISALHLSQVVWIGIFPYALTFIAGPSTQPETQGGEGNRTRVCMRILPPKRNGCIWHPPRGVRFRTTELPLNFFWLRLLKRKMWDLYFSYGGLENASCAFHLPCFTFCFYFLLASKCHQPAGKQVQSRLPALRCHGPPSAGFLPEQTDLGGPHISGAVVVNTSGPTYWSAAPLPFSSCADLVRICGPLVKGAHQSCALRVKFHLGFIVSPFMAKCGSQEDWFLCSSQVDWCFIFSRVSVL